jgi:ATP-dependent Clp protease protease subunit
VSRFDAAPMSAHLHSTTSAFPGSGAEPLRIIESRAPGAGMTLNDSVYDRLLRERIIFLGQPVDDTIANQICAQLLLLSAEDNSRDINLYINSPGGSVTAGMAIYDTMTFVDCDVATYALGLAASMGQFLLSAGTRGKRYALPHARILMHQPSAGIGGTASDIRIQAEQFKLTKREMAELIAEHTGQSVDQVQADSERDRWFTAQQALEYGFVDHVVSRVAQMPSGAGPAPA